MLDQDQKKKLADEIKRRIPNFSCPICQNKNFIMADGYFNNNIQTDFKTLEIGGPSIPSIALICNNCGFVSQHALGVLGQLPKDQQEKK